MSQCSTYFITDDSDLVLDLVVTTSAVAFALDLDIVFPLHISLRFDSILPIPSAECHFLEFREARIAEIG